MSATQGKTVSADTTRPKTKNTVTLRGFTVSSMS